MHFRNIVAMPLFIGIIITICNGSIHICDNNNDCSEETIECEANEECTVICAPADAQRCFSTTVLCPVDYPCNIHCLNWALHSCRYMNISARYSSSLLVNATVGPESVDARTIMDDSFIYCPINQISNNSSSSSCNIICDGDDVLRNSHIYAVEAWNDVTIDATHYSKLWCWRRGIMHCTLDYSSSCIMQSDRGNNAMDRCDKNAPNRFCETFTLNTTTPTPTIQINTTETITTTDLTTTSTDTSSTTTVSPTTSSPTTPSPTTSLPTASPTTSALPTTSPTTTSSPTISPTTTTSPTRSPTTASPTTAQPTAAPTTAEPTTSAPTNVPTEPSPYPTNEPTAEPTDATTNPPTTNTTMSSSTTSSSTTSSIEPIATSTTWFNITEQPIFGPSDPSGISDDILILIAILIACVLCWIFMMVGFCTIKKYRKSKEAIPTDTALPETRKSSSGIAGEGEVRDHSTSSTPTPLQQQPMDNESEEEQDEQAENIQFVQTEIIQNNNDNDIDDSYNKSKQLNKWRQRSSSMSKSVSIV